MSYHIFRDGDIVVDFPIVDLEFKTDEIWKDGSCSSHCFDGLDGFAGLGTDDGKAVG